MDRNNKNGMREAPNYINASIVMFGFNLVWVLIAIWATFGFLAVIATAFVLNALITILRDRLTLEPQPLSRRRRE